MKDFGPARDEIMPVPIRLDRIVYLHGIPLDLTKEEADKIARVVMALANPDTRETDVDFANELAEA